MTMTLYTARVLVAGATALGSDRRLDVKLSRPGGPRQGTNPEQSLAAGWSACFEGAMAIAVRGMQLSLPPDAAHDTEIDLAEDAQGYFLRARMMVSLPEMEREAAQPIVDAARRTCPYSKALRGNIDIQIELV